MPRQARATPAAARVRPGNDARRNPQIASAPPPSAETQRSLPPTFCLLIIESSSWSRNHAEAVPSGQCDEAGDECDADRMRERRRRGHDRDGSAPPAPGIGPTGGGEKGPREECAADEVVAGGREPGAEPQQRERGV